ncbi:epidermal growth factor-like protein 8 [Diorhabda sublineata]|uniref:epidermal growth factor-like protein 8 n=1 Tax=Diorhabda sublineata TaxID=1163346 RepID=UPI0024E0B9BB|nr:epidermal growth factor-like protein 8 [Diorhabda sublineata]
MHATLAAFSALLIFVHVTAVTYPNWNGSDSRVLRNFPTQRNHSSTHRHLGVHRHGYRAVNKNGNGGDEGHRVKGGVRDSEMEKMVVDANTGIQYNPYAKHHPGRHVCTRHSEKPVKSKQPYCKPTFKNYVIRCQGNQICKGVRLVYETHYKDVVTTKTSSDMVFTCCPGWTQATNKSNGCNKATCSKPCLNGGKCVKPEKCACPKGFAGLQCEIIVNNPDCRKHCFNGGQCLKRDSIDICNCPKGFNGPQCEINLNKPYCTNGCENGGTCIRHELCLCTRGFTGKRCEIDIDECREQKPCDQICYNTPGSYNCQCKEDFILQTDGQSCRKEDDGDVGLEAKDLEFEILDKRLLKLETMMDESHKNDVSKDDLQHLYRDMNSISQDISSLKNKINDVENYKNDMYVFKNKLTTIEKKAEKVDELMLKYDRMKKCAFYNKICM